MKAVETLKRHRRLTAAATALAVAVLALLALVPSGFAAPRVTTADGNTGIKLSTTGRDVVRAGGNAYVGPNETVDSVTVFGGDAVIAGTVRHQVVAVGGDVRLRPTARVGVDMNADDATVVAIGGETFSAPGAIVTGTTGSFQDVTAGDALVAMSVAFVGAMIFVATMTVIGLAGMLLTIAAIAAFIWLIVWLIRRDDRKQRERAAQLGAPYGTPVPAAPYGPAMTAAEATPDPAVADAATEGAATSVEPAATPAPSAWAPPATA